MPPTVPACPYCEHDLSKSDRCEACSYRAPEDEADGRTAAELIAKMNEEETAHPQPLPVA